MVYVPKRAIFIFSLVIGIAVCIVLFAHYSNAPKNQAPLPGVDQLSTEDGLARERTEWSGIIVEKGAKQAWGLFRASQNEKPETERHLAAHLFGRLLYEKVGVTALSVCDSSYGFGCYHGFFGAAVAGAGLEEVGKLDAECVRVFGKLGTGCQHGLGHGLMEYFGPENLQEALAGCLSTTQLSSLFGCTSGVFMEYNTPTTIADATATTKTRTLDIAHPFAPCKEIADKAFRLSCIYELGPWWQRTITPVQMLGWCKTVSGTDEQEACALGVGNAVAIQAHYIPTEIREKCTFSSVSIQTLCVAGGAWSVFSEKQSVSEGARVCEGDATCLAHAPVICNFMSQESDRLECLKSNNFSNR